MFESQIRDVNIEAVTTIVHADFDTSHREIDTRHQVLLFDLQSHLFGRRRLTNSEQATGIKMRQFVACRRDDAFDRVRKGTGADCPITAGESVFVKMNTTVNYIAVGSDDPVLGYTLNGDTLTLTDLDTGEPATFTRVK